jgi:hypothetical protein
MYVTRELAVGAFVAMIASSVIISVMCAGVVPTILGVLALIEFVLLFIVTPLMFITLVVVAAYAVIALAFGHG